MITEVFNLDQCPNRARDLLFSGTIKELKAMFQGSDYIAHEFQPNRWAMWDNAFPWRAAECKRLFGDLRR